MRNRYLQLANNLTVKQTIVIFLLSLLVLSPAAGQSKEQKQLIKNLDGLISQKFSATSPGCAVLVASKGKVIYKKAFGSANLELNVPLRPEMVFSLASITKQFTAIAILQLEEQGKLSLQDSVQKFIPDFPSKQFTITIENLLTHTSGIKDYLQIGSPQPFMERWDFTSKELIDFFKSLPLEFEPGTRYKYSNSGYALLGYIIEKVSGKSYQAYMSDNILKPSGLYNTYYDSQSVIIPNRVSGYYKDGNNYRNAAFWSPSIAYAAGGLLSNVEDLFLWHRGLLSYKIVKKETLDKAFTEYKLKNGDGASYGYGWIIRTINGERSIEHAGSKNGFVTNEIYFPKEDVFIALLFNSEDAPRDDLSIAIAGLALGKSLQQGMVIASDILDTYIGTYVMTSDPKRKMTIEKGKEGLIARVSANESLPLLFQSATKFQFKNILDANCEFKKTDGKVTGFVVDQHGSYEWKKTE
jgi:CubicO group peptidase (beta-lactamase class C family)